MTKLDFGLLFTFRNGAAGRLSHVEHYASCLELIRDADAMGYDTIWFGEHHFSDDGHLPSPMVAAAATAAITKHVRIASCVLLTPFYNAVRLAEDIATVDVMSNGRVDVGLGQGYVEEEFAGFGVPRRERRARFVEAIDVLTGLWTQDRFSYAGAYNTVGDAHLMPKPVQVPHPPIWLGAMSETAIARVAALGHNLLATSDASVKQYDAMLAQHGRDPAGFKIWRPFWVHVAESDDLAWANAGEPFREILIQYGGLEQDPSVQPGVPPRVPPLTELREYFDARKRDNLPMLNEPLIGSPQSIIADLHRLLSNARMTHLSMGMGLPGLEPALVRTSMQLFIDEVAPVFG